MHIRAKPHHNLMQIATQHRIHAHLKALADPYLLSEEVVAILVGLILRIRARAVRVVCFADGFGDVFCSDYLRFHGVFVDGGEERFEEVSEPPECHVVLGDFLGVVPG